ncbi:MAG: polysaccharide deacetylase family protein [Pseudomonadota bacterium]
MKTARFHKTFFLGALTICAALFGASACAQDNSKRIALTYDDAPRGNGPFFTGEERTAEFIAALERADLEQAAIFVTTQNLKTDADRDRIAAYAAAGHVIANHSHTHPWANRTDVADYIADIDKAEALLEGFENRRSWFRFPFLDEGRERGKRDALREALAERDLLSGYVTVDTYDWHMEALVQRAVRDGYCVNREALGEVYVDMFVDAAEHYHAMALETLGRAPAQVLLLHENDVGAMFADDLVAGLRDAGWEIITADEAYADPLAVQLPDTTFSGKGRIAAFAKEADLPNNRIDHPASDEAPIAVRFAVAQAFHECEAE